MPEYVYAILNTDDLVTNVIVADSAGAEDALLMLIEDAAKVVLVNESTGPAYIGQPLISGRFRKPSPYPSWLWDEDSWGWVAPVTYPNDGKTYGWDEAEKIWIEVIEPDPITE